MLHLYRDNGLCYGLCCGKCLCVVVNHSRLALVFNGLIVVRGKILFHLIDASSEGAERRVKCESKVGRRIMRVDGRGGGGLVEDVGTYNDEGFNKSSL